jgi:hypothetical protein
VRERDTAGRASWRLDGLCNDRGRSLPDVWNARFAMPDTSASVGSAGEFARRAIFVAESRMCTDRATSR